MPDLNAKELEELLALHNAASPSCGQVNTKRTDSATLLAAWNETEEVAQMHPWLSDCIVLRGGGSLEQLHGFAEGLFYVQDPAAQLVARVAAPKAGMRVLDACAAPGGKSFAMAIAMQDTGEIQACDIHEHKIGLLEKGAERWQLCAVKAQLQDATVLREDWKASFDVVLADVP